MNDLTHRGLVDAELRGQRTPRVTLTQLIGLPRLYTSECRVCGIRRLVRDCEALFEMARAPHTSWWKSTTLCHACIAYAHQASDCKLQLID